MEPFENAYEDNCILKLVFMIFLKCWPLSLMYSEHFDA